MKKCIIFCAAEFDKLAAPIEKEDYLLAADGGLRHLEKAGLKPNGTKLPKVRIGVFASFLTVKGDFNIKVFAVQLVVSSSEVFVELKSKSLRSLSFTGVVTEIFVYSSLHLPLLSSCS